MTEGPLQKHMRAQNAALREEIVREIANLPLAACGSHVDRCLVLPLPPECTQEGGGGPSLLARGDVPPKPEPGPAPAPEPQPEPKPEPPAPEPTPPGPEPEPPKPHPKPDHHDDDDRGDHDDRESDDDREHDDD